MECKYRPTDNARSILSPIPHLACSNHSTARRSLRWRYFQSRSHGIEERLEIGAKTPRSTCGWVCVCVCALPRTRKEGRKEGSKTWLTVDHRSHQDTSSLPPSLFLSLRFTDRGTPPPSIILLERETPLSLSLLSCPGEAWWRKSVFHRGWNEIMEPELREARKNKEEEKCSSGPNARRRIERDESFSTLSLSLLSESDPPPPRYYPSRELTFARSVF